MKNDTETLSGAEGNYLLDVQQVSVKFGGLMALDRVDLRVETPGIRGVIGPNGAGKTTLFNAITGFVPVQNGSIRYEGEEIAGYEPHVVAGKGIIRTFQHVGIFPEMSVLENVMTGHYRLSQSSLLEIAFGLQRGIREEKEVKEKALRVLESVGLSGAYKSRTGDLSYGQQRLVEIARALISEPKLLLLDEPGAGLSSAEKEHLIFLLRKFSKHQSVHILLTDHSMDFIMGICDFITVLNYGKKIGEGTPKEIQENEEVIEAYLGRG